MHLTKVLLLSTSLTFFTKRASVFDIDHCLKYCGNDNNDIST